LASERKAAAGKCFLLRRSRRPRLNRYTIPSMLRTVQATRYVLPLREGGPLPAIVEADDPGLYVVKFRGAGHGVLALIAEIADAQFTVIDFCA
jgi:hypothetical protein